MDLRTCPHCGHPVSDIARFCPSCGDALPEPALVVTAEQPDRKVPWRAIEAIPVFLLQLLATAILAVPAVVAIRGVDARTGVIILINEVALLAVVLGWVRLKYREGGRRLGLRDPTMANVAIGVGIGIAGLVLAGVVSAVITKIVENVTGEPVAQPDQIGLSSAPHGILLWVIGLSVVVLAPIAEETFFRGFLYQGLRRWAKPWAAVVLSAAVFAVSHLIPLVIPPIFALGIILAWLLEWRGSLVPGIVAHMTFNAVGFATLYLTK